MLTTLVALALLAEPLSAPANAPAGSAAAPRARTVAGRIVSTTPSAARLVLEAADGPLPVRWDRNTMVLLEGRTGTPRDLLPGLPARVALAPDGRAWWIELRPRGLVPTPGRGETAPEPALPPAPSLASPTAGTAPSADPAASEAPPSSR